MYILEIHIVMVVENYSKFKCTPRAICWERFTCIYILEVHYSHSAGKPVQSSQVHTGGSHNHGVGTHT